MDHLRETLAFRGGSSCIMTSVDTNNVEKKKFFCFPQKHFPKKIAFFSTYFGVTGLQVQDELEPTPPLRLHCEKMVVDLVGWSKSAPIAEK